MKKTKMLKKNYEFRKILSKGKYYSGSYIEAFILKSNPQNVNFLGLAISSKLCKAVRRNHIKRLLRENYYFYESKIKSGYSIIFLWKKKMDIKNAIYKNINSDMQTILKKAEIWENK